MDLMITETLMLMPVVAILEEEEVLQGDPEDLLEDPYSHHLEMIYIWDHSAFAQEILLALMDQYLLDIFFSCSSIFAETEDSVRFIPIPQVKNPKAHDNFRLTVLPEGK